MAVDYYSTFKYHFNIQSDDMFEGVHVSIVNFMEYIFKMRINVYEIHSLKKRPNQDRINPSRESYADKYQPVLQPLYLSSGGHVYKLKTLNLLLHDNHCYTIKDMNKLMAVHYRCISCGQIFKGRRMSTIKMHIQNRCGKICYRYRRGAVQPHMNMWEEAKTIFSIPDELLSAMMRISCTLVIMQHMILRPFCTNKTCQKSSFHHHLVFLCMMILVSRALNRSTWTIMTTKHTSL